MPQGCVTLLGPVGGVVFGRLVPEFLEFVEAGPYAI
jgi:hypothetical protein